MPYSGELSMVLDTGASFSVPVSGTYQGTTYAPAVSSPQTPFIPNPLSRCWGCTDLVIGPGRDGAACDARLARCSRILDV